MSNIIPFPTHRNKKKETHKFKTIGDWTITNSTITFTDIEGVDIKINLNDIQSELLNMKTPDYTLILLDEIQSCVEKDPGISEYINSNLERILKIIRK